MIEYLLKYLSETVTQKDIDTLNKLKQSRSLTYENAKEFALYLLEGLDWCDEMICRRFDINYVDFLNQNNFTILMTAYIRKKDEKLYKIHKKVYRKRI